MQFGQRLPAHLSAWRVVEKDLYDIARQVREYDEDARLVYNDQTGQLGLGVHIRKHGVAGPLTLARDLMDPSSDMPLTGEPDQRVMRAMRAADSRRFHDIRTWQRQVRDAEYRREIKAREQGEEAFTPKAEEYVHLYGKDAGVKKRIFVPDRERAAA